MPTAASKFGFCSRTLELEAGSTRVRCLPDFEYQVQRVFSDQQVAGGWIYAPAQPVKPFSSRVFGLPKTHVIEHSAGACPEHLDFLVWTLSFFLGMRLTTTEAGFLDATPIKPGKLVDFTLADATLRQSLELADEFWQSNDNEPRNARRFKAAIHALFLSKTPTTLAFESFVYLYMALDACYALGKSLRDVKKSHPHTKRIGWLCEEFGTLVPDWAETNCGKSEVSGIRNDAMHEALFMGEPLGFEVPSDHGSMELQMSALVCRLLVALLGGTGEYVGSSVASRQRQRLDLT